MTGPDEMVGLIEFAEREHLTDWLVDALYAVVSVCNDFPGSTATAVLDAIRRELANTDDDDAVIR
jgi:hypothetical protein